MIGPLLWLQAMLAHEFIRHALLAGTGVALASGLSGYFLVLRNQVFAADALGHVAFTGALAALAFGLSEVGGLLAATLFVAVLLSVLATGSRSSDVAIGAVFAWTLGLGVLFLSIFVSGRSGANGAAGVTVLFGSIFGVDLPRALLGAGLGAGVAMGMVVIARPLLFASLDDDAARAWGVPVRWLGLVFLLLVAVVAAQAVQVVGALLMLGLIATPAAIAQRLTTRPYAGMLLSAAAAVGAVWAGITLSYAVPRMPPSFAVIALLFGVYVALAASAALRRAYRPGG
jgi:zinc/manganese transport system permease protein